MGTSRQNVPYSGPLLDVVALFDELGIHYALIGGVAAMYYGRSRFTEDVDFVAAEGYQDILQANAEAMRSHHFDPSCTWKLYHDSGVDVDIWKDEFTDQIVARAHNVEMAGRRVRIADAHDLIAMKLRAGRIQDDYDVSEILKGTAINDATVQASVTPEQYQHYLAVKARR